MDKPWRTPEQIKKEKPEQTRSVSGRVTESVMDALIDAAEKADKTLSGLISEVLTDYAKWVSKKKN